MPETQEKPKLLRNRQAIIDWCKNNKPDATSHIEALFNTEGTSFAMPITEASILIMLIAFEAGREFGQANPDVKGCWDY